MPRLVAVFDTKVHRAAAGSDFNRLRRLKERDWLTAFAWRIVIRPRGRTWRWLDRTDLC